METSDGLTPGVAEQSVLIVDDEKIAIENLQHIIKKEGYEVHATQSGANALKMLDSRRFDVVLTDLKIDKVDGMQVLKKSRRLYPDAEVILITGFATLDSAVNAMKEGAFYYIAKPFRLDEVRKVLKEAMEKVRLKDENRRLRQLIQTYEGHVKIITQDQKMVKLLDTVRQVAPTDCNVLIRGESGTGKELFARYLHYCSNRRDKPFFAINCGTFTGELLSNELFGHEKGAFTGAVAVKKGLMEMASGGSLFLDEITEMPPPMQVKLLRVVQERELLRVGGVEPVKIDVRFIAATNKNLNDALKSGEFRQDLYFRLNVVSLLIPPLSERKGDIPLLCHHFLNKYSAAMSREVREISKGVFDILAGYDFPGNVRELENIIERGVALSCEGRLDESHLPDDLKELSVLTFRTKEGRVQSLEEQETAYIEWVLKETGGNKTLAAQLLGIDRVSLWRKLRRQTGNQEHPGPS
jgi:DNA-binding NtrC family response regulator